MEHAARPGTRAGARLPDEHDPPAAGLGGPGAVQAPLHGMSVAASKKSPRHRRATAQAAEVSYALHTLGWKAFQDLCASITSEVWGQTVQSFLPSGDAGRDGAFTGEWQPAASEA